MQNDRIVAVEQDAHSWEGVKTIGDLGKQFVRELQDFFVNYNNLTGDAGSSSECGSRSPTMETIFIEPDSLAELPGDRPEA